MQQIQGWYPDPWRRGELRWWNGAAWTEHVVTGQRQWIDLPAKSRNGTPTPPSPFVTPAPNTSRATTSSMWTRFRHLPTFGQVGLWIAAAFIVLVVVVAAANPNKKTDTATVNSRTAPGASAVQPKQGTSVAGAKATAATTVRAESTAPPLTATTETLPPTTAAIPAPEPLTTDAPPPTTSSTSTPITAAPPAPITTTLPPAPAPTAPQAPAANAVCSKLQKRSGDLVCGPTGFGPLWLDAPFVQKHDQVALMSAEFDANLAVQVDDMAVGAANLQDIKSFGQNYRCVVVGMKNFDSDEADYSFIEFSLLTPTGNLQSATIPLINNSDSLLSSGGLASNGVVSGAVCFDRPRSTTGRFAIVYDPFSFTSDARGVFYFDR